MMYPKNELSLAEVIRRYNADEPEYEVTKKLFGSVGLLLLCVKSVAKEKWAEIVKFIPENEVADISSVEDDSKCQSGFWKKIGDSSSAAECLRDALAHRNIYFNGDKKVERIILWNSYKRDKKRMLKSVLSMSVDEFSCVFEKVIKFCEENALQSRRLFEVN